MIVPSARPATSLQRAISVTAGDDDLLVVMCSKESRPEDVIGEVSRVPGARALVVPVPGEPRHVLVEHATSGARFRELGAGRDSDLSRKRNLALALARSCRWSRVLLLDDDVLLDRGHLARAARYLGPDTPLAAFRLVEYPDHSVACHAHRLTGGAQDPFVSGAALGAYVPAPDLPFFPDVYDDDWFAVAGPAAAGGLLWLGDLDQLPYDPFDEPDRAAHEEFGDTVAEGVYAVLTEGTSWDHLTTSRYWEQYLDVRREFLETLLASPGEREHEDRRRRDASVRAALAQHEKIEPADCVDFVRAWCDDRQDWAAATAGLGEIADLAAALARLGLSGARWASFDRPSTPVDTAPPDRT